jgi:MoxR-like ATPase
LTVLNERTFRRGHTNITCPLRICVGASNRLPDDEQLAAFADRFLVRIFVEPIGDSGLEELLSSGWSLSPTRDAAISSMDHLDTLTKAALEMDLTPVRSAIAHGVRLLRGAGIELTDRRIVRTQRLVAGAAALAGRSQPTEADLWPIVFALPTEQAQHLGRDVLGDLLAGSENPTLVSATAESSLGPRARGARILREGLVIMDDAPTEQEKIDAWRLRVEGIAREIDATFTSDTLPADLAALRARIVELLTPSATAQPA